MLWYLFTPPEGVAHRDVSDPKQYTLFGAKAPQDALPNRSVFHRLKVRLFGTTEAAHVHAIQAEAARDGKPIIGLEQIQEILHALSRQADSARVKLKLKKLEKREMPKPL